MKKLIRYLLNITLFIIALFIIFSIIVITEGYMSYGSFEPSGHKVFNMIALIISLIFSLIIIKNINNSKLWVNLFKHKTLDIESKLNDLFASFKEIPNEQKIVFALRVLISGLFLLSAFAKLYPTPMYGITKVFEEGQLIPMGFSENIAPYFSRLIIGAELFLAITILFNNYLKKLILPLSILMISIFSIHLISQLFGTSENCGCFGDLIPMTPLEALIKNIVTLIILAFIYKSSEDIRGKMSNLLILFLSISTIMFAWLPFSSQSKSAGSSFITYVENEEFVSLEEEKILCFFDAGCEHCQHAARSLDSLSNLSENFPLVHIIFSDTEEDKIPYFFEVAGKEYNYQIMPFANYDTDEIDSYMEITFPDYDNPVVILYDRNRQIRLYDGTEKNEFKAEDLVRILENE